MLRIVQLPAAGRVTDRLFYTLSLPLVWSSMSTILPFGTICRVPSAPRTTAYPHAACACWMIWWFMGWSPCGGRSCLANCSSSFSLRTDCDFISTIAESLHIVVANRCCILYNVFWRLQRQHYCSKGGDLKGRFEGKEGL